jgi:hypothetical protein
VSRRSSLLPNELPMNSPRRNTYKVEEECALIAKRSVLVEERTSYETEQAYEKPLSAHFVHSAVRIVKNAVHQAMQISDLDKIHRRLVRCVRFSYLESG